jgi:hypothetical protein
LIQVAAALHQILDLKRTEGPRRTLAKARARLAPYAPEALGIEVGKLLEQVTAWEGWLAGKEGEAPPLPRLG